MRTVPWLLLTALLSVTLAQGTPRQVDFTLGFKGALVADAWNPFRLTTRDVGSGVLTLRLDQGSLLEGELPWRVRVPVVAGPGLRVHEGDLFIPRWRSFVWSYEAGGRVLASGSYARDLADSRPLDLVVASNPSLVAHLEGARLVDVTATELPVRVAAFDGVRSIWFDGSLALASPAAMTAAAVAGSLVILRGMPAQQRGWSELLGETDWRAIGAGGWWTGDAPTSEQLARAYLPRAAIIAAFVADGSAPTPGVLPRGGLLLALAGYVLLIGLAWRAGGLPGILTWVVVVAGASVASWVLLGNQQAQLQAQRTLLLEGGSLAQVITVHDVRTLPDTLLALPLVAHPAAPMAGELTIGAAVSTAVTLARGRAVSLVEVPTARSVAASEPHASALASPLQVALPLPAGASVLASGSGWRLRLPEGVRW